MDRRLQGDTRYNREHQNYIIMYWNGRLLKKIKNLTYNSYGEPYRK